MEKLTGAPERPGAVTFQGRPLTLVGPELKVGDPAPDFTLVDQDLRPVSLKDFSGKIKVLSVTPSLDTPVCDLQARRFNQEAAALSPEIVVLNVSVDLPFAIARFCAQAGIDRVQALSDYRERAFGRAYGLLIKELQLLSRAVLVLDQENRLRYFELVREITQEPDYAAALSAVRALSS
ncbi:thiol peroxidase [Thermosulfurimonas marina]|uniref:Thiol peroxidase n=2 Tax=Thermosulfurimonas marina TaxID=2047767 RepID=A0A6H1WUW8_9BACT|nr:thiol peroxidase [Thermosulfurimonas marina]